MKVRYRVAVLTILLSLAAGGIYFFIVAQPARNDTAYPLAECQNRSVIRHADITYLQSSAVSDRSYATLDIYQPVRLEACPKLPVLVWLHGGGFVGGDKSLSQEKVNLFTSQGYVVAAVSYRLTSPDNPVRMPGQVQDVAAALSWLQGNVVNYGGQPSGMAMVGFSAGAYLVSLLASDERYLKAHNMTLKDISCVVSLDTGAYDLLAYTKTDDGAVPLYLDIVEGGTLSLEDASPQRHIEANKDIPRFLLVTRNDNRRPLTHRFAEVLRQAKTEAVVIEAPAYTHSEINTRLGIDGERVITPPIIRFLQACNQN